MDGQIKYKNYYLIPGKKLKYFLKSPHLIWNREP